MKNRLAAIEAFVSVVEAGSFAGAAEHAAISTSSLSRQVADLEKHLGARLIQRTTRRLSLTETGQTFYERCVHLLAELADAEAAAAHATRMPRGVLKLTCSAVLADDWLGPAMARCAARYPALGFDVTVTERIVDLVEDGFDLALRIGSVGSEQLVARRIGSLELVACAAPAYLERVGRPREPADLGGHNALIYAHAAQPRNWTFVDARGASTEVRVEGCALANSGALLVAAAVAGLGIAYEPEPFVRAALASGRLERVLIGWRGPQLPVWAVYPSRRHLSAKVRLFVDEIAAQFDAQRGPPSEDRSVAASSAAAAKGV